MKRRILVADIGNTSILFGYYVNTKLQKTWRLATFSVSASTLKILSRQFPLKEAEALVIASVVPHATRVLVKHFTPYLRGKVCVAGKNLPIPIKNLYDNPREVGVDRLMNAVAIHQKHAHDAIIVDFGTAITFDVVTKKGEYLGGVIAPGIEISLEALYQRTALLPKIRLQRPRSIIGRNTIESIRAGCTFGIGGLCERVIEEIKKRCRLNPRIYATGGYARFMSRYLRKKAYILDHLTLEGIRLTYIRHFPKKSS